MNATSDTDFELNVSGDKSAPLLRGSGTATLVFGYTVVSSDEDDDGIWIGDQDRTLVGARRLMAQSGTITSVATSTAADLTHAELGQQSGHKVDGSRSIVSVAVSSTPMLETDTYGAGETIRFTVTFNLAVDVSGDPVLAFALGNQGDVRDVDAAHESGTGTTALVFAYTVVSTDEDNNGIFLRDENDFNNPDGPVRLDSDDTIQFTGTSTDVPLYWQGRGTQSGHKVDGSRTSGNNAPVFQSDHISLSLPENSAPGTVMTDSAFVLTATDADTGDTLTYSMEGPDAASFDFDTSTREMKAKSGVTYNFEATQNTYSVTVKADDGTLKADAHRATDERYTTDIDMRMGALGVRGEVVSPKAPGGFAVNVKSDAFWVRMDSDAVASEDGNLHASQTDASRVRLVLEGSRAVELDEGTLTPSLELGLRHDGGDAETGTGLEAGAGLRYAAGALTIGAQVRTLVAHEASGYEEWGVSGSVRLDPGASGRGLSLKLAPVFGAPSSGVEHLWSARDAAGLVGTEDFEAERRLEAELGYGIGLSGTRGLLIPYTALSWRQGGARTHHRTGARWQLARAAALGLEWTHEPGTGAKPPANALMLRTQVRW